MASKYSYVTHQAKIWTKRSFLSFNKIYNPKNGEKRDPKHYARNTKNYASNRESTWSKSSPLKAEST